MRCDTVLLELKRTVGCRITKKKNVNKQLAACHVKTSANKEFASASTFDEEEPWLRKRRTQEETRRLLREVVPQLKLKNNIHV